MVFLACELNLKPCPACNYDLFKMRQCDSKKHTGAYCGNCGRWIKWLGQKEIQKITKTIPTR